MAGKAAESRCKREARPWEWAVYLAFACLVQQCGHGVQCREGIRIIETPIPFDCGNCQCVVANYVDTFFSTIGHRASRERGWPYVGIMNLRPDDEWHCVQCGDSGRGFHACEVTS